MNGKRLLCLGYGYTSAALARRLAPAGWRTAGTTRSPEKARRLKQQGVEAVVWDGGGLDPRLSDDAGAILIATPPDEKGCPALRAAKQALADHARDINWLAYLSTNGVYGDHGGAWVDEETELRPTSMRARRRVRAEAEWRAFAAKHDLPLITFRLPGIYGPGRSAFDAIRAGNAKRIVKQGQVFSRMHVDDIAAALEASMRAPRQHDLYNLADDEPAPPQDVVEFACTLLGVAPPPLTPIEEAGLSDMAQSFYTDNKRVSNQRMKAALGIALQYPTYRDGLKAILKAENKPDQ